MAGRQPIRRVRVVVVDHDGGAMTLRCIESLHASTWDGEQDIVLVDNASSAPVVDEVARRWPDVRVVRCARNLGFAGGANAGIGDLRDVDAVALVNNDAVVRAGWLAPLVAALEHDDRVGAACPKILLSGRYVEVAIASPATHRRRLDRRPLGVRLHDVHAPGGAFHLARGFWGPERGRGGEHQWTNGDARLFAAVGGGDDAAVVRVLLSANGPVPAQVCAGGVDIDAPIGPAPRWITVPVVGEAAVVVNNVGTVVRDDWYGADRGYLEVDRGQYDRSEELEAWCGGAVLLAADHLGACGRFDERLFLYYEDLDLALRGRRRGWRFVLVPDSVVDHDHSATAVSGSDLAEFHKERNRLVVMWRYAPRALALRQTVHYLASTLSYLWRDVVVNVANGDPPTTRIVRRRLRSLASACALRLSAGRRSPSR